jgi:hypothetical protein
MLSLKLIRLFLDMRANDLLPQADLLLEMLDAQDAFDMNNSCLSLNTDLNCLSSRTPSFSQHLTTNNNNNSALIASPSVINNSIVQSDYQTPNNYIQRQDSENKTQNVNDLNGKKKQFVFCLNSIMNMSIKANEFRMYEREKAMI